MWVSLSNEEKTNRKEEGIAKGNLLSEELMAELTIRMKKYQDEFNEIKQLKGRNIHV